MNMLTTYEECTKYLIKMTREYADLDDHLKQKARNLILDQRKDEILDVLGEAFDLDEITNKKELIDAICYDDHITLGTYIKDKLSDLVDPIIEEIWNDIQGHAYYAEQEPHNFQEEHEKFMDMVGEIKE